MRLLVTGGSGYLGSEVAARAAARGEEVFATHRVTPPEPAMPVRWVCVDLSDSEATERMITALRPDAVVHTAYRATGPRARLDTVGAAVSVARAARRVDTTLIHMSSDVVFSGRDPGPLSEAVRPAPVSAYGRLKAEAEQMVTEAHSGATVVRTSLIYGGTDRPGPQERLVEAALADPSSVLFHSDEVRCPVHVGDLAAALLALVDAGVSGIWHLGGPRAVDRLELARALARSLGRDPAPLRGGPTPVPAEGHPVRPRHLHLDSSRFRDRFGPILRDPDRALAG